jgi:hypothetical protein
LFFGKAKRDQSIAIRWPTPLDTSGR